MFFQLDPLTVLAGSIIVSIVVFLVSTVVTRWYAVRKGWSDSWVSALIINVLWLIIDLVLVVFFGEDLLFNLLGMIIEIILGAIVVMFLYQKEFVESLIFVIVIVIIIFILAMIFGFIMGVILGILLLGTI
ncbi:MAG: hypothetical protein ACFFCZ_04715 [Promethearchaeota archaeon]